jgi:hypothetical protein
MINVVNTLTGEILELPDNTPVQIKDAWLMLSETIKMLERAKDKLKPKVADMLEANGTYDFGDYMFRQSAIQRTNYDKAVMRQNLDADTFDLLLVPDKPRIDNYLKENLENLGDVGTILRSTMVAVGEPYTTIRLEKIKKG